MSAAELRDCIADVACHFFGPPNRELSNARELRFGKRGSIRVDLVKGTWSDFETGEGGGALDLVMREARLPNKSEAGRWLWRNGFARGDAGGPPATPRAGAADATRNPADAQLPCPADEELKKRRNRRLARATWDEALPARGTIVERYLVETRKLELPDTEAIRYHPRLPVTGEDRYLPAMVCALTDIRTDELVGVHRTFLTLDAQKVKKTTLGDMKGAVIKIDPDGAVTTGLAIAEGIESTIAARYLYRPAWCVVCAGGMGSFPVLTGVEHLEIFADNDAGGTGLDAARRCLKRWQDSGASARIILPTETDRDVADIVAEQGVY
jgi:hypothetical protein